jgi:PncC family amidohydrolase
VSGASEVFNGGIVSYSNETKVALLGVDPVFLAEHGPANAEVAEQMALGARQALNTEVAISTTGVAGPGPAHGVAPGVAYIAVKVDDLDMAVRAVRLKGDRNLVRARVVARALELCEAALRQRGAASEGF